MKVQHHWSLTCQSSHQLCICHMLHAKFEWSTCPSEVLPSLYVLVHRKIWLRQCCVIQATVLIETLPAAFEMDEILFELREHSAGLNCGRWDYIFSFIKTLRGDPNAVMPDRYCMQQSTHDQYSQLELQSPNPVNCTGRCN